MVCLVRCQPGPSMCLNLLCHRGGLFGFADSRAEKPARATFYSAVIRAMGKDTIVIADGMNYIKGSRYQMYCQAREVSVRTCTVSRRAGRTTSCARSSTD